MSDNLPRNTGPTPDPRRTRLGELLADRAAQGLDTSEEAELLLIQDEMNVELDDSFERAAAALAVALTPREPLPPALFNRILAQGQKWASERRTFLAAGGAAKAERRFDLTPNTFVEAKRRVTDDGAVVFRTAWSKTREYGGWLAAAACLTLAVLGWIPKGIPSLDKIVAAFKPDDLVELPLVGADGEDRSDLGVVVWSTTQQKGFVKLRGLAANNPEVEQYQAWVYDEDRDPRYPVNAAVFNVVADSSPKDQVIPIETRVKCRRPALVMVTKEVPGGVVVSGRERIAALAKVDGRSIDFLAPYAARPDFLRPDETAVPEEPNPFDTRPSPLLPEGEFADPTGNTGSSSSSGGAFNTDSTTRTGEVPGNE